MQKQPGIWLEHLTWLEAEQLLTPQTVVVLPLGAAAKEHGPHLPLNTDRLLAAYLAQRVAERVAVVLTPTVTFHYYPAFVEYPGSISLQLTTARDTIIDICRSLAAYGPRRFYVLNTGVSTVRALAPAAEMLAAEGITMRYTNLLHTLGPIEQQVAEQAGGSHADEIETSMLLYIAPQLVDMAKAARDYHPGDGPLTRTPGGPGAYSATGIYGDATLATREKGQFVVEALVEALIEEIEELRSNSKLIGDSQ